MLHEKRRPVMQFDATSGLTAAVLEMLVFSTPDRIRLLPALPASWRAGSLKGVRTRAGVEVDLLWDRERRRINAQFFSVTGQSLSVKLPASVIAVQTQGDGIQVEASSDGAAYRRLTLPGSRKVSVSFELGPDF
jgi:hypothetical protein